MATSEIQICNLALANIGDTSLITSISPPDGSVQAQLCAQFYPLARDALLERHSWGFATKRVALAQLPGDGWTEWDYTYAQPADAVNILAILPAGATDDYSEQIPAADPYYYGYPVYNLQGMPVSGAGIYPPQPYSCEVSADGTAVILTDQPNAVLRYTAIVTNPVEFSPLFTVALSWKLSAMLAGPIMRGAEGAAMAQRCEAVAAQWVSKAIESDAGQRRVQVHHNVRWIAARS